MQTDSKSVSTTIILLTKLSHKWAVVGLNTNLPLQQIQTGEQKMITSFDMPIF